jgi:DNA gyrase subunit A
VDTRSLIVAETNSIAIEEEMQRSYLDYAMSVIVSRALPDVRDGLKPVHRRILYAMKESGYDYNRPYRKSARIVGDVMGKYHPHGDAAIYDAMVRMAQEFSMRLPLIDGQGNFGSMDGDPAAAMRYTEARLNRAAHDLLSDIDKDTVNFNPNYDESSKEPGVLPARFPNLLVNGAGGIAVGMATNIPSHNLGEVIDACCAYIDEPNLSIEALMQYVPGPDFPTGGIILGRQGILDAYRTGRGSILIRSKTHIEEVRKDRSAIIVTEIPYQVNKSRLLERIAEVVQDKTVEGVSDLRDESDRDGVRVVIELKREAAPDVVLNQLFRHTPLQTSFGANVLALDGGRPKTMNLKEIIKAFIEFRQEVIVRRTHFELKKAQERAHLLIGLAVAVENLDEIISLIRSAPDPQTARRQLMERSWGVVSVAPFLTLIGEETELSKDSYFLSDLQAKAILDLRLHRLTGLERDKIHQELQEKVQEIDGFIALLNSKEILMNIIKKELLEVKDLYANDRRTLIEDTEFSHDIEALIQREEMIVTVSHGGYIKRVPLSTYRAQRRGGKGRSSMAVREEDFVTEVFVANTHTPILFFSSLGKVYKLKAYRLPLGTPQARGKALINLLPLAQQERISTIMALPEDEELWSSMHIVFVTSKGGVRRNALSDFVHIKANGKIAMKLEEDEQLVAVKTCQENQDILLSTRKGRAIRFNIVEVREFASRTSTGVRGIKISGDDRVISMSILDAAPIEMQERDIYLRQAAFIRRKEGDEGVVEENSLEEGESVAEEEKSIVFLPPERFEQLSYQEQFLLTVTEKGFGKRTSIYEYRLTGRGGLGIADIDVSERNGLVIASFPVAHTDHIVLVTDGGKLIRCPVEDIRIAGRRTLGVRLFRIDEEEKVVSVACLKEGEENNSEEESVETNSVETEFIEGSTLGDSEGEENPVSSE